MVGSICLSIALIDILWVAIVIHSTGLAHVGSVVMVIHFPTSHTLRPLRVTSLANSGNLRLIIAAPKSWRLIVVAARAWRLIIASVVASRTWRLLIISSEVPRLRVVVPASGATKRRPIGIASFSNSTLITPRWTIILRVRYTRIASWSHTVRFNIIAAPSSIIIMTRRLTVVSASSSISMLIVIVSASRRNTARLTVGIVIERWTTPRLVVVVHVAGWPAMRLIVEVSAAGSSTSRFVVMYTVSSSSIRKLIVIVHAASPKSSSIIVIAHSLGRRRSPDMSLVRRWSPPIITHALRVAIGTARLGKSSINIWHRVPTRTPVEWRLA
mmetsp:Transcript_88027/g.139038  ORF Transcript_88027/g.139038 Transcript_88027/m.139038 type:complete len:327 (-) Transcript_88027:126-1106(-)